MGEVTVTEAPRPQAPAGIAAASGFKAEDEHSTADISVLLVGKRLEITANVDAAGLVKLKEMLDHYEKILKLV